MMDKKSKIFVAGPNGMVGSAIVRKLRDKGYRNLLLCPRDKLDLLIQDQTLEYFIDNRPEYVFLAAALVGGIWANDSYPASFIYNNIQIQTNVIHFSFLTRVKRLVFLGSSCVYPKYAPQPMREIDMLTGLLEPTNEAYAIAKIAGTMMCRAYNKQYGTDFITVMPTNLYGKNDHYDLKKSHVLPALIRKFHEAKMNGTPSVVLWGTGKPLREFLHVDDLAEACIMVMNNYNLNHKKPMPLDEGIINIGSGEEITIFNLACLIKSIVGYEGIIDCQDDDREDGTPRKLIDSSKIGELQWEPKISLVKGIEMTYREFKKNYDDRRGALKYEKYCA